MELWISAGIGAIALLSLLMTLRLRSSVRTLERAVFKSSAVKVQSARQERKSEASRASERQIERREEKRSERRDDRRQREQQKQQREQRPARQSRQQEQPQPQQQRERDSDSEIIASEHVAVRDRLIALAESAVDSVTTHKLRRNDATRHRDWLWLTVTGEDFPSTPRGLRLAVFMIRYRKPDVWEVMTMFNTHVQGFKLGDHRLTGADISLMYRRFKDHLAASLGSPVKERRGNAGALQVDIQRMPDEGQEEFLADYIRLHAAAVSFGQQALVESLSRGITAATQRSGEKYQAPATREEIEYEEEESIETEESEPSEGLADSDRIAQADEPMNESETADESPAGETPAEESPRTDEELPPSAGGELGDSEERPS